MYIHIVYMCDIYIYIYIYTHHVDILKRRPGDLRVGLPARGEPPPEEGPRVSILYYP